MGRIRLEGVSKVFPGDVTAVDDVNLTVDEGEFLVLVGPSGCGKSTLLRMIAGLEDTTHGRIVIGDREVTRLGPRDRDIAMVFQNYALYPHMTVRQNLSYGLRVRRLPKKETDRRVHDAAKILGLEDLLDRKPSALSGGQRQRVAMGRAIVREPAAFLMDEPLSNLDAKLRVSMRASLGQLHARLKTTTVYVTHDQTEAMTLGQRVAVMRDGKVQQHGSPRVLYREPRNLFVAAFLGSPSMNLVEATISGDQVRIGSQTVPLDRVHRPDRGDGKVVLGIRPEDFDAPAGADPQWPRLRATIDFIEELGADRYVTFKVDAPRPATGALGSTPEEDDGTLLSQSQAVFMARLDGRTAVVETGAPVSLALNPDRFYFFDAVTGENLISS